MNKADFQQGMSHDEALKKDLAPNGGNEYLKAIPNLDDYGRFYNSFYNLFRRPDYDGSLTKAEADKWWLGKSGEPLFVDQSKIGLSYVTTKDFGNVKGSSMYKNFIWKLSNTGQVYGTLKLTLLDANTGAVHIGPTKGRMDGYDYKTDSRVFRNFATWAGRPGGATSGTNFNIFGYGHANVPVRK